ncbi:hypothetical protein F5884DRAFT_758419 [Xylogone sp. PMI_703]|nr:hypothetical protein F5884DRAFT_758419 [Xylogone sp. PMI_703]
MTTYYIDVINNSAKVQKYFLFVELPTVDGVTEPYSNVFAAGRPRQPDGSVQHFAITTDAYAVCGYQQINKNVIISGEDNTPMHLDGTDPNLAEIVVIDGGPGFVTSQAGADPGTFKIHVQPFDQGTYPDVWCGYGKMGALGDIHSSPQAVSSGLTAVPGVKVAACWQADPDTDYIVRPVVKFYIATGSFTSGEAVILTEIGAKVAIDFTNEGKKVYASVSQNSDGTYNPPTFSPTPPRQKTKF